VIMNSSPHHRHLDSDDDRDGYQADGDHRDDSETEDVTL